MARAYHKSIDLVMFYQDYVSICTMLEYERNTKENFMFFLGGGLAIGYLYEFVAWICVTSLIWHLG